MLSPPYPRPWILAVASRCSVVLGIALAVAVVVTWRTARTHPAWPLATGLVLASVAYPLVWVTIRTDQLPTPYWLYNGAYPLLLAVLPLLARARAHAQGGPGHARHPESAHPGL